MEPPDDPRVILGECINVSEKVFRIISWGAHMGWHDIVRLANEAYGTMASIHEQLHKGPLYYSMTGRDGGRVEDAIGHWRRARNIRVGGKTMDVGYVAHMGSAPDTAMGRSTSPPEISILDRHGRAALYAGGLFTDAGNGDLGGAAHKLGGQLDQLFHGLVETMPWIDTDPSNGVEPVAHNTTDGDCRYRPRVEPPDYRGILTDEYIARIRNALFSVYAWAGHTQEPCTAQWARDALVAADSLHDWIYGGQLPDAGIIQGGADIHAGVERWRRAVQRGEVAASIQGLPFPLDVLQETGPPAYYAASIMKSLGDVVGSRVALRTADGVNRVLLKSVLG